MPISLRVAGRTDRGLVRQKNEDNLLVDEKHRVFAVCDGMGGHQAGEVASQMAVETVQHAFDNYFEDLLGDQQLSVGRALPPQGDILLKAIRLANRAITRKATRDTTKANMGTTIVATAFEADIVAIGHVGDSRAYRLTESKLEPMTRDHSWVTEIQESQKLTREEADQLVGKNIITRALGVRENVEVDLRIAKVREGDIFILCSDGLCGFADDEEIHAAAKRAAGDIKVITDNLVDLANSKGGMDNVTVIAIEVLETAESPLPELEAFTLQPETAAQLSAEDAWLEQFDEDQRQADDEITQTNTGEKKTSPLMVISIFAVFIIVAALIIYFSQRP